jgi:uncharacterized membrane protein YdjX (TVP38/TMEM64 family)
VTRRILLLCGLLAVGGVYLLDEGARRGVNAALLVIVSADIEPFREYLLGFGWWAPVISTALQVVTSVFAPLPSFMLSFANAMLYGAWWGAALTWTSALLAAAICFWISRTFGRPAVERFVPRVTLDSADRFFLRHGALAVVLGRVIPFINPDVVSYVAGLTPMGWRIFMVSIAVGSIPSTALYSYLGSQGFTTVGWLFAPLVGLGVLAFVATLLYRQRSVLLPVEPTPVVDEANEVG